MRNFRHTFFNQFSQNLNRILLKIKMARAQFLESACSFYLGFIIGNLFGTFLDLLRNKIIWDGIILIMIIFFFEFINFIIYKQARRSAGSAPPFDDEESRQQDLGRTTIWSPLGTNRQRPRKAQAPSFKFQNKKLLIILKNFQIGILFGFFIDAFKVGS